MFGWFKRTKKKRLAGDQHVGTTDGSVHDSSTPFLMGMMLGSAAHSSDEKTDTDPGTPADGDSGSTDAGASHSCSSHSCGGASCGGGGGGGD